jgi:cysteinyl-tRNA synthetase
MDIYFTNSFSGKKEQFSSILNNNVSLYVCGITPYDHAHLGHARCYISFDFLVRVLNFFDYKVTYIRNFTDIDDKIINKVGSDASLSEYKKFTTKFIASFKNEMQKLGCLSPTHEPLVTKHISEIIKFIEILIQNNAAYEIDGDVYFDISKSKNYGALSKKKIDELLAGARVKTSSKKRNPGDFALWKGNNEKKFWQSPWGYGRPGWHIECSVLAKKFLGKHIDIHGGGSDLLFPHHENEKAQSEAAHKTTFVNYWLHNAFVNINNEKMSKSLKNIISLQELIDEYDPMALRYYFLSHHYRSPIEFSFEGLNGFNVAYQKLTTWFTEKKVPCLEKATMHDLAKQDPLLQSMVAALCDDLNIPKFFGILFQNIQKIKENNDRFAFSQYLLHNIAGLTLEKKQEEISSEAQVLIEKRNEARKNKDWKTSDEIREKLKSMGIIVKDTKS